MQAFGRDVDYTQQVAIWAERARSRAYGDAVFRLIGEFSDIPCRDRIRLRTQPFWLFRSPRLPCCRRLLLLLICPTGSVPVCYSLNHYYHHKTNATYFTHSFTTLVLLFLLQLSVMGPRYCSKREVKTEDYPSPIQPGVAGSPSK